MAPLHIWIGYDSREAEAFDVCAHSIVTRATVGVRIHKLEHRALRRDGLFDRPWRLDERGQWWDERDGRPFSTEFSHSRFLVPELARREGAEGWALFLDSDMLCRTDVAGLLELADPERSVMCVQHQHEPAEGVKMDGMAQLRYRRKNWSSLVLWNLDRPDPLLCPRSVNRAPGGWLHAFEWLADRQIGALPATWNWLVGHTLEGEPDIVHFTEGGPWFPEYADLPYAEEWRAEQLAARDWQWR